MRWSRRSFCSRWWRTRCTTERARVRHTGTIAVEAWRSNGRFASRSVTMVRDCRRAGRSTATKGSASQTRGNGCDISTASRIRVWSFRGARRRRACGSQLAVPILVTSVDANGRIRTVIVDDEKPARTRLLALLEQRSDIEVVGVARDGREAVALVRSRNPTLLFLDIQMPELDGFGVLREIPRDRMPVTIFVTAHDRYAVRAFEAHAVDYLLKPFSDERFEAALEHARKSIRHADKTDWMSRISNLLGEEAPCSCRVRDPSGAHRAEIRRACHVSRAQGSRLDQRGRRVPPSSHRRENTSLPIEYRRVSAAARSSALRPRPPFNGRQYRPDSRTAPAWPWRLYDRSQGRP